MVGKNMRDVCACGSADMSEETPDVPAAVPVG